jgi:hypothetical protein
VWSRLVLPGAPARLPPRGSAYRPICYELCGVLARTAAEAVASAQREKRSVIQGGVGRLAHKITSAVSMRYQRSEKSSDTGDVGDQYFLFKSVGSGRGTRTPDPRIMIPVL